MSSPPAIVLAGGLGTRVASLHPDLPKPMIPVAGKPFLAHVLGWLAREGVARAVLSVGYKGEVVERWATSQPVRGLELSTAREDEPLGTAGGFLAALASLEGAHGRASEVLVVNGDSLVLARLAPALERLRRHDVAAVLLGVSVADGSRFGRLEVDADGRLRAFEEKRPGPAVVNAGVYLFRRGTVDRFPRSRPLSFEREVFPALLAGGSRVEVETTDAPFLDMGTPESLAAAHEWVARHADFT